MWSDVVISHTRYVPAAEVAGLHRLRSIVHIGVRKISADPNEARTLHVIHGMRKKTFMVLPNI